MVSILVLVDAALRHKMFYNCWTWSIVSILVLVDAALRRFWLGVRVALNTLVSILVLVDAALRQTRFFRRCNGLVRQFQSLF